MIDEMLIRSRYGAMGPHLDERERRLFAAAEARTAGYGGVSAVARATGIARSTINRGLKDLDVLVPVQRKVRRAGGGRPCLTQTDPTLLEDLQRLLEPATVGDPMRPLMWVSKSHAKLAAALRGMGHQVSASRIPTLLERLAYRRQVNRKTKEGSHHPDRDAQFEHINKQVIALQAAGQPVISVDTKKKELIGAYKNAGSDYRPEGCPDEVNVHDFVDKELGKAIPYGVYDIAADAGCVSVGIDHDTAEFAVNAIRRWHKTMGCKRYPTAARLMITADGGGSNGSRVRLWKIALQKLADETRLTLQVCHYPPGTSKWNKIEHRLFCHITQNWRGRPLTSRSAVVELIAATTTKTGLTVRCELDTNAYAKGIKVSDAEMATLNIKGDAFHPEWNYTISPTATRRLNMKRLFRGVA
jgi:Rhodopirellula transposase DDE domain